MARTTILHKGAIKPEELKLGLVGWVMMIPTIVVGCLVSAAYGAGCMVVWAYQTITGKGKERVRPE